MLVVKCILEGKLKSFDEPYFSLIKSCFSYLYLNFAEKEYLEGFDGSLDIFLNEENWRIEDLWELEKKAVERDPVEFLDHVEYISWKIYFESFAAFFARSFELDTDDKEKLNLEGKVFSFLTRTTIEDDESLSNLCAIMALNLLLNPDEVEKNSVVRLQFVARLVQSIPHCALLEAISAQFSALTVQNYDYKKRRQLTAANDLEPSVKYKKEVVQNLAKRYMSDSNNVGSREQIYRAIRASIIPELEKAYCSKHESLVGNDPDISRYTALRWIEEILIEEDERLLAKQPEFKDSRKKIIEQFVNIRSNIMDSFNTNKK